MALPIVWRPEQLLSGRPEGHPPKAGVECVVRLPFEEEKLKLKLAVRQALRMTDPVAESKPRRWSFGELVLHVLQRLKSA
jgi:hypothetical protein